MSTAVRSRVFKIPAAAIAIGLCLFSQDDVSASIKERRVERLNAQIYRVYEYGFRGGSISRSGIGLRPSDTPLAPLSEGSCHRR